MDKLTKDISDIIISEINALNEKIKGLNFLENLKNNLIVSLMQLLNKQKFPIEQEIYYEKEISKNSRNVKILINYLIAPKFISKKKLDKDSLFLIFNEVSNFDIYEDKKNFKSIILHKNTGISLPKDTVINSKYNKHVLLIEIININSEELLTK